MTGTNCDLFKHKSSRSYLNHLELIAFPRQQLFLERASVLRYKCVACIVDTCPDRQVAISNAFYIPSACFSIRVLFE